MEYFVHHHTAYRYAQEVSYSHHIVHLAPRRTATQTIKRFHLSVSPNPTNRECRTDYFNNPIEWFALNEAHAVMEIVAESQVSVQEPPERDAEATLPWENVRKRLEGGELSSYDAIQYAFDSPLTAFAADLPCYASESFIPGRPVLAGAIDLMSRIHTDFRYDSTVTDATTPVDRVFEMRAGVCQDFAHVAIATLRSIGLPARYVSGYLLTQPPPGKKRLIGADASHAWFSVWAPPFGWVDLDPTNNVPAGAGHITVAWGRDYGDVAPINGIVTGGGEHLIEVAVDVVPAA